MAVYVWQGVDSRGKDAKGVRDADNPKALRLLLRKEGVLATSIEEESAARVRQSRDVDLGRFFQRVSASALRITGFSSQTSSQAAWRSGSSVAPGSRKLDYMGRHVLASFQRWNRGVCACLQRTFAQQMFFNFIGRTQIM